MFPAKRRNPLSCVSGKHDSGYPEPCRNASLLFNFLFSFLSIYVIGAMLVDLLLPLPIDISQLMQYMDYIVCVFFFVDFCQRFITAERKLTYMRWGWIDLLA